MYAVPEYVVLPALVDLALVPDTLEKYALGDMSVLVQSQRQEVTAGAKILKLVIPVAGIVSLAYLRQRRTSYAYALTELGFLYSQPTADLIAL